MARPDNMVAAADPVRQRLTLSALVKLIAAAADKDHTEHYPTAKKRDDRFKYITADPEWNKAVVVERLDANDGSDYALYFTAK
jgi:hypothetical protein